MALLRIDRTGANTHLESIVVKEDGVPNGALVVVKDYNEFDNYKMDKVADLALDDIVMIHEPFMNYTGYENESEMTFKKDKVVRAYRFLKDDIITITIDGVSGATNVKADMVGKYVVPVVGSYVGAISATKAGSLAFEVINVESLDGKDALVLRVA